MELGGCGNKIAEEPKKLTRAPARTHTGGHYHWIERSSLGHRDESDSHDHVLMCYPSISLHI